MGLSILNKTTAGSYNLVRKQKNDTLNLYINLPFTHLCSMRWVRTPKGLPSFSAGLNLKPRAVL